MARLNGSLPVVELPSYYDFSSALQIEERTHLAVSVILLYEYFLTMDQEECIIVVFILPILLPVLIMFFRLSSSGYLPYFLLQGQPDADTKDVEETLEAI
ncbi:hypothetical protein J3A83DRAFT_4370496 [Scleroderma citrinum]